MGILDMVMKPTDAYKCWRISYMHSMPHTSFSHSCGHPQGGALHGIFYKLFEAEHRCKVLSFKMLVYNIY